MDNLDPLDKFMTGKTLDGNWLIEGPRDIARGEPTACRTYTARDSNGNPVFVKVHVPGHSESLAEEQRALDEFAYEKMVTDRCGTRKMRRVIRGLGAGEIRIPGDLPVRLHYLVLESADSDIRSQMEADDGKHAASSLRWLHHLATGLDELHFSTISHEDVQPAHALVMPDRTAKLGGLAAANDWQNGRPHGDADKNPVYAAPEILYRKGIHSFDDRCALDMYQLGSLAVFLFHGISLTTQMQRNLEGPHHWKEWTGSFADAMPYLKLAFDNSLRALEPLVPDMIRARLMPAIRELADPDPALRGHPLNRAGRGPRYGLARYVSLFDLLARHAEMHARRAA
jgi:eukaryotic-like serine/threonine-protein kinase